MIDRVANKNRRISRTDRIFYGFNLALWIVVLLITLYPLYLVLICSVSDPDAVTLGKVVLWPIAPSWRGYQAVFRYSELMRSYLNSIIYTVSGTALSIFVTLSAAYALSQPKFPGKGAVNMFLIITMFFSGGLIPTFLVMRDIGLYNNPLMLIVSGCVSVWNLMVARVYIQTTIPKELYEAAVLDGATHFSYFFRIVLPLSGTIIGVLCIYYGVGIWNDYFTGLVYIHNRQFLPLQTILREIIASLNVNFGDLAAGSADDLLSIQEAMRTAQIAKYCVIVISSGPVILLYLCMQKYFVKGVMIGSLKG